MFWADKFADLLYVPTEERELWRCLLQGKGYMKTYWLKGKKDLSFKTPAELRYSSEQKDSQDKSSNG